MADESTTGVAVQNAVATARKMSGKQKLLFGGGIVFVLAVTGPVAVLALATVKTVAAAGIIGAGIFAGLVATPMLTRKWKNVVLKVMKSEARKNPIETLENMEIDRAAALERGKKAVNATVGILNSMADQLEEFKRVHGVEAPQRKAYDRMAPIVQKAVDHVKVAEKRLEDFRRFVSMKRDEWKIAGYASNLQRALKEAGAVDPLDQLLADEAFKSVDDALNVELAELDSLLSSEGLQQIRTLPAPSDNVIDLTAIEVLSEPEMVSIATSPKKRKVT